MKYSAKMPPPIALQDWLALANEDWQPKWADFAGEPKEATRTSLLTEQGYVCAYCGCGVQRKGEDSHIEHFWPRHAFPDQQLAYGNLFISCGPPKARRHPLTCGAAKGEWEPSPQTKTPAMIGCEEEFSYLGDGSVTAAQGSDAEKAIHILKLNDKTLKEQRKSILQALEQGIRDGVITAETVRAEIAIWRGYDPQGRQKAFGHVAARYLEDEFF